MTSNNLSESPSPKVSVVVLNWNGKRFIDDFVSSFLNQTYPQESLELVFTDNNSGDGSVEYLEDKFGKKVKNLKTVINDDNYGYAGGNNRGIKQASGDFVLICNNDLELDSNLVKELVKTAQEQSADITVPKLMFKNRSGIINNAGSRLDPSSTWPIYEIGANEKDAGQYDDVREISAVCGACMLIRRDFFERVGLFDEKFFMYFEDGDLSWRGQKQGNHFYYAPKAVALHVHTGSSKEGSPLFNHFVGRNRILILAKNARFTIFARAYAGTIYHHFFVKLGSFIKSVVRLKSVRHTLHHFWLSQKMLWSIAFNLPYAFLKRFGLIKEDLLR